MKFSVMAVVLIGALCAFPASAEDLVLFEVRATSLSSVGHGFESGFSIGWERSITKRYSAIVALRKDGLRGADGWILSAAAAYRRPLSGAWNGRVFVGVDAGLMTSQYATYEFTQDERGRLTYQRWMYAVQDGTFGGVLTLSPYAGVSASRLVWRSFSARPSASVRFMRFGIKEARRESASDSLVTVRDGTTLQFVPVISFSLGYSF